MRWPFPRCVSRCAEGGALNVKHHDNKWRRSGARTDRDPLAAKFFGGPREPVESRDTRKFDRKARQLCRQVYRTLSYALGGLADPVLQELSVHSVEPAPDASRLLVNLLPGVGNQGPDVAEIMERLLRVRSFLRQEVAMAITRKRAPELLFHVVAAGDSAGDRAGEVMP